jgi:hypothetical protein
MGFCNKVFHLGPVLDKVLHEVRMHNANKVPHKLHVMYDITFFSVNFFFWLSFLKWNSNFGLM